MAVIITIKLSMLFGVDVVSYRGMEERDIASLQGRNRPHCGSSIRLRLSR